MGTQKELPSLNGLRNTFYCGSYFGYGFHEDAVRSGVEVARKFGEEL
jgi:predicted NAD/FAD-binding protein